MVHETRHKLESVSWFDKDQKVAERQICLREKVYPIKINKRIKVFELEEKTQWSLLLQAKKTSRLMIKGVKEN